MSEKRKPAEGESAGNGGNGTFGTTSIVPQNTLLLQPPLPGQIWAAAERRYHAKISRRNGHKRFDANSLDFFTLCNIAGPVAWATQDTITDLLNELSRANLLKCDRQSSELNPILERVWSSLATADYAPSLLAQWGEAEHA